jgi:hypothetical protein
MDDDEIIAYAERRRDAALRNFKSGIRNGATAGSLAFRRQDEQEYALACATLVRYGRLNPIKRKYRLV